MDTAGKDLRFMVEVWNKEDFIHRYDSELTSPVNILVYNKRDLESLIIILIESDNPFTVQTF